MRTRTATDRELSVTPTKMMVAAMSIVVLGTWTCSSTTPPFLVQAFSVSGTQGAAPAPVLSGRTSSFRTEHNRARHQRQRSIVPPLFASLAESQGEALEESAEMQDAEEESEEFTELTVEEFDARLKEQLAKMSKADEKSMAMTKEDLKVVFEDKDIIVVDKPVGVLTVGGKEKKQNLADTVFNSFDVDLPTSDHMVVHRLPMDVSGVIALAKNMDALRRMNGAFRERKVERKYEVLVAGHVKKPEGVISLPLMRDYECPPYVRVSTHDHQLSLLVLEEEGGLKKKYLQLPKDARTQYLVLAREELNGQPVTRLLVTMHTGRYHQLNCHMAAFGHPIVGDLIYTIDGDALPNGGLTDEELDELIPNRDRASDEVKRAINEIVKSEGMTPCVHHKSIQFRHPLDKFETLNFVSDAPF